jgi:hypothetical protein
MVLEPVGTRFARSSPAVRGASNRGVHSRFSPQRQIRVRTGPAVPDTQPFMPPVYIWQLQRLDLSAS